jgi:hypothetical protein
MSEQSEYGRLLDAWTRRKRDCDDLTQRYLSFTITTPVSQVPEAETSLTAAALNDIARAREAEEAAWQALAAYLGRHHAL